MCMKCSYVRKHRGRINWTHWHMCARVNTKAILYTKLRLKTMLFPHPFGLANISGGHLRLRGDSGRRAHLLGGRVHRHSCHQRGRLVRGRRRRYAPRPLPRKLCWSCAGRLRVIRFSSHSTSIQLLPLLFFFSFSSLYGGLINSLFSWVIFLPRFSTFNSSLWLRVNVCLCVMVNVFVNLPVL